jgi:hypothetical protein
VKHEEQVHSQTVKENALVINDLNLSKRKTKEKHKGKRKTGRHVMMPTNLCNPAHLGSEPQTQQEAPTTERAP